MQLFLITLALYAINGPKAMQVPCAVGCIVLVPVWLIVRSYNAGTVRSKQKRTPDMSYLYEKR